MDIVAPLALRTNSICKPLSYTASEEFFAASAAVASAATAATTTDDELYLINACIHK